MKEFFLILLFSKTVLLTPVPIDLYGKMEFNLENPIDAITSGASIQVDISSMFKIHDDENILQFRSRVKETIPPGSVVAILFDEKGEKILLEYKGGNQFNGKSVMIILTNADGVPIDRKFKRVVISSKVNLEGINIYWKNFKH
jgi:hypothetical protein